MIISCEQCNKKFDVESSLIPTDGRLLQCSSCNHKWFYKKEIHDTKKIFSKEKKLVPGKAKNKIIKTKYVEPSVEKEIKNESKYIEKKDKKKVGILSIIIIFLITFVALIILIDTFKKPIEIIIPNIDYILKSLYESLKDISLFIKDLF